MRRFDVITAICDAMETLGWGPYQNDHEDANGQFEMNWTYADCLLTADRHAFFKYMVKTLAERHGLRATFMPKPFRHLTGNGCHMHVSLWDGGTNVFNDPADGLGLSARAYQFLGGIMNGADQLCAVFNPTVNSYKRLNAPVTLSGATWSPNMVTWSGNNRTHMVRVPDAGRFELRLADGAMNPYLGQAAVSCWASTAWRRPATPARAATSTCTPRGTRPRVRAASRSTCWIRSVRWRSLALARAGFGSELVDAYTKLKRREWDRYCGTVTDWERETTLDC